MDLRFQRLVRGGHVSGLSGRRPVAAAVRAAGAARPGRTAVRGARGQADVRRRGGEPRGHHRRRAGEAFAADLYRRTRPQQRQGADERAGNERLPPGAWGAHRRRADRRRAVALDGAQLPGGQGLGADHLDGVLRDRHDQRADGRVRAGQLGGASAGRFFGLVVWLIGLGAIILLWQRQSSDYFKGAPRY